MQLRQWFVLKVVFTQLLWCLLHGSLAGFTANVFADNGPAIPYKVQFSGIREKQLIQQLGKYSKTVELQNRPPASLALLERRAEQDLPRLTKILRSFGYLDAEVIYKIESQKDSTFVDFQIDSGQPYNLVSFDCHWIQSASETPVLPPSKTLGLEMGKPVNGQSILEGQTKILKRLQRNGYPFPRIVNKKLIADSECKTAALLFEIDPGKKAVFGETSIEGLDTVRESFIRNRLEWEEGDLFDSRLLDDTRLNLFKSNLFAMTRIELATTIEVSNKTPVTISLTERKPQTIGAGAEYRSDDGPGGKLGWEHRNLFGEGERLAADAMFSGIEYSGGLVFKKPDFYDKNQSFLTELRIADDHPDPYSSRNIGLSFLLERILNEEMKVLGGVSYRLADVTQLGESNSFGLLSLPAKFEWLAVDDVFNPTEGGRLKFQAAPYYDTLGTNMAFFKSYGKYSHYFSLVDDSNLIFASQIGVGSLVGDSLKSLPADERFYAGGGGSIRGYPYQMVSPLQDNHPIGGRSILELSFELRMQLSKHFGFVTFLDGGAAFESVLPDSSEDLLWGTGVGLRIFTPIGPFRLDVGFPLNKREAIDDSVQIYISIGQAF